jgi:mannosyltransferase OCH1-like enzyme
MIYKNIHQIWFTGDVPEKFNNNITTLKKHHTSWSYKLWSESDIITLIREHYADYLDLFNSYTHVIQKCDVARYFILHHCGGLYVDLDITFYKNIEHVLSDCCVLFRANPDDGESIIPDIITNSIYYSPPGDKFLHNCIRMLSVNKNLFKGDPNPGKHIFYTTSPGIFTKMYNWFSNTCDIKVNSHIHFEPIAADERLKFTNQMDLPDECIGLHMSVGDWWR